MKFGTMYMQAYHQLRVRTSQFYIKKIQEIQNYHIEDTKFFQILSLHVLYYIDL